MYSEGNSPVHAHDHLIRQSQGSQKRTASQGRSWLVGGVGQESIVAVGRASANEEAGVECW